MTREQLFDAMIRRTNVLVEGRWGVIQAIEMEDGSGFSFNVRVEFAGPEFKHVYIACPRPNPTLK